MEKKKKKNPGKNILIAEDDPLLIDIYRTQFIKDGFEVDVVACGKECLEKLKEKKYDLMLLDIVLPKIDGWEILRRVGEQKSGCKKRNKTSNLKIIILSNLGLKEEIQKGLRLGADGYLIKAHYTPSQVADEAKRILSQAL